MSNSIDSNTLSQLGLTGGSLASPGNRLGQEDFLELMVTQLTNQDPFKPMESGEFLGQLAQFGTVSGISDVQQTMSRLADSFAGSQTLQASALVDRKVLVPSREAWLPPDGGVNGAIDVPDGASNIALEIVNLGGESVGRIPLPENASGLTGFDWDGTLADGERAEPGFYELRGTADIDGESQSLDVLVSGRVESVTVQNGSSPGLTVTGLGRVDLQSVRSIQ